MTLRAQKEAIVKARLFYSIINSGLDYPWPGPVFMNPPYAGEWIDKFSSKFIAEYQSGMMTAGIMLTNGATDTQWWHAAVRACNAVCFTTGRVKFLKVGIGGKLTAGDSSPSHGHTLFYFGPNSERFAQVFGVEKRSRYYPRHKRTPIPCPIGEVVCLR